MAVELILWPGVEDHACGPELEAFQNDVAPPNGTVVKCPCGLYYKFTWGIRGTRGNWYNEWVEIAWDQVQESGSGS